MEGLLENMFVPLCNKRAVILLRWMLISILAWSVTTGCSAGTGKDEEPAPSINTAFAAMEPPHALRHIRFSMKPGLIPEEVKRQLGDGYSTLHFANTDIHLVAGTSAASFWRYDIGAREGYTPAASRDSGDWADVVGLQDGRVYAQLLIEWKDGKTAGMQLAYRGADRMVQIEEVTGELTGPLWSLAPEEPPATFREDLFGSSYMIDVDHGWATGRKVWRTSDGGRTWLERTPPRTGGSYNGLAALDADTFWTVLQPKEETAEVSDAAAEAALRLHNVYATRDGGTSWVQLEHPLKGRWGIHPYVTFYNAQFVDKNLGYLYAYAEPGMVKERKSLLLMTTDGGRTWQVQSEDITNHEDLGDATPAAFSLRGSNELWMTYGNTDNEPPVVFRSTDSGRTWERVRLDVPAEAEGAALYPAAGPMFWGNGGAEGFMAFSYAKGDGNGFVLYSTKDGGLSWTSRVVANERIVSGQAAGERTRSTPSLYAYDPTHLWLVDSEYGDMYRSSDGGITWQLLGTSPSFQLVNQMVFVSPSEGRAYSRNVNLYTKDGGVSWAVDPLE